jgi:hypothetical protein
MKDVAIIASVIPQRFELLSRSMVTWQKSIRASGLDCDIYLYIEGASIGDALKHIPHEVGFKIEAGAKSGSHCFGYNHWFERVQAKTYLWTHPDLLYPKDTVSVAFANAEDDTFVAFKAFWMGETMTKNIECYNWRNPEMMECEKMLYDDDPRSHGTMYSNDNIRNVTCWESSTTYAVNRQTANKLFPLPDFGTQGADDPYQAGARQYLGIKNYTVMEPILMHQWHPNSWFGTGEDAVRDATTELRKRFGG